MDERRELALPEVRRLIRLHDEVEVLLARYLRLERRAGHAWLRVIDAERAIIQVKDYLAATSLLAQTTLRSVLGQHELDEMLAEREKLNTDIQKILDEQTDAWGIKVSNVEIKRVDLDESMIRAIARQAEAERERRAKVIHAEGELQASERLLQAAQTLAKNPQSMQLRFLQTLTEVASEKSTVIAFPLPIDMVRPFVEGTGKRDKGSED